jgi:GTP-binding protein EngB required for normal cell division
MKKFDIEYIAIDQSGSLGSLVDRFRDTIMGKFVMDLKSQSFTLNVPIVCKLHKGCTSEAENLLEIVDIDRSLRVSIISKLIQPTGIASIIDYPRSIDKYTRFLYYCQTTLHETCHEDLIKRKKLLRLPTLNISATHIITQIISGIHAVVVLQIPPEQHVEIDHLLEEICNSLSDNRYPFEMTSNKKALLGQIISTTVYSNIPTLTTITELHDVWQRISQMRDNSIEHRPLKYMLSSIQLFYPDYDINNLINGQIYPYQIKKLEHYLFQQLSKMKALKSRLDDELPKLLQGTLEEQLNDLRQDFSTITKLCKDNTQSIRNLVLSMRKEELVLDSIDRFVDSHAQIQIKDSMQRLSILLDKLIRKGSLIRYIQHHGFTYCNVAKLGIEQGCNEQLVKDILFKNDTNKAFFCSHDSLKKQFPEQWNDLYSQMMDKRKENPQLNLFYADFTYSTFQLENMVILSSKEQKIDKYKSNSEIITSHLETIEPPSSPLLSNNEYINILLIGESGVGKSTFINAFANYLQFGSLQQAQSEEPVVVIPVSFLMTVNDNFDEQLIKFGEPDPNENHKNPGQSVTQQCRSYVFDIFPGKKLRIIDTPGFGDARGDNQDDINMKRIISFMNNLTHLNGVCLLFKPNVGRLNPFLYSCFAQLFQYFGENIRDHFIFCFTNARATFFAPGDTRPLLQSLFNSFVVKNIPFEKKNTFCFDSESFRYLVALQSSLTFNEVEKYEFEKSWKRSVEESKRLQNFLCRELHPYRKNIEWQSIQEAQFQINCMIRPMLEAIRNILRNILLYDISSSIKLKATCVDHPTMICYKCDRTPKMFNQFWIYPDHTHNSSNKVSIKVVYRLNYLGIKNIFYAVRLLNIYIFLVHSK